MNFLDDVTDEIIHVVGPVQRPVDAAATVAELLRRDVAFAHLETKHIVGWLWRAHLATGLGSSGQCLKSGHRKAKRWDTVYGKFRLLEDYGKRAHWVMQHLNSTLKFDNSCTF